MVLRDVFILIPSPCAVNCLFDAVDLVNMEKGSEYVSRN